MVDFAKRARTSNDKKPLDPIEIYKSLDRKSTTGPLRPSQQNILRNWYEHRKSDKNVLLKLHTGEGKTLIGLLALLSKLNESEGPCIYLCPNKYLAHQVSLDATKFGIPHELIEDEIPESFLSGKKILISHVQKLFNGMTKFGLDNHSIEIHSLVLDDSHACIEAVRQSMSINIKNKEESFGEILSLFEEPLKKQGLGSFLEIKDKEHSSMLPIPYWSWYENKEELTNILMKHKANNSIKFAWPILKNSIENCHAFISGKEIEILPFDLSVEKFGSFHRARHRILMSATTQDDSFMIKGFGFSLSDLENPLTNPEQKWSGEKAILIPFLLKERTDRDDIVNRYAKEIQNRKHGVVFITPSSKSKEQYEKLDALVTTKHNIEEHAQQLRSGNHDKAVVFVNRYDGIDLPDDSCRILILDSIPYFDSLYERYQESCRRDSDFINLRIAQKIEQGIGRSVRGEKDYSAIILSGSDLAKFVRNKEKSKHFSAQTKMQIKIGREIIEYMEEDNDDNSSNLESLDKVIRQVLDRDDGWKSFYVSRMNEIEIETNPINAEIFEREFQAEKLFLCGKIEEACEVMQEIADSLNEKPTEKGWYLQHLARYRYRLNKDDSNTIQKTAFRLNNQLLKPQRGVSYQKLDYIHQTRVENIQKWISGFDSFENLMQELDDLFIDLSFGKKAESFEMALAKLGEALGFLSERPDKTIKKGPDNLWCCGNRKYIMMECKSEVLETRRTIKKSEASQMNSHCAWFDEEYKEVDCKRILIIHTKALSYECNFTHEVEIMRKKHLQKLKRNTQNFFEVFQKYKIDELTADIIQGAIDRNNIDVESLFNKYSEAYVTNQSA